MGESDKVCFAVKIPTTNRHHHTLYLITTTKGFNEVTKEKEIHPDEVDFVTRSRYYNLVKKAYYRTNARKTYLVLSDNHGPRTGQTL